MGCDILGQKKLNLDDYLDTVLKPSVPWDELALLMFARMYKIQFFSMGANKFWSTNISRRRYVCRIWFLYQGGLTFSDTVKEVHIEN